MHGSEVPYGLDTRRHHSVRNFLRGVCGHGDDAEFDIEPFHDALQSAHVVNGFAIYFGVYDFLVVIERRHDVQAVVFKTAVTQKRFAESSDAHQNSVVSVVISQKPSKSAIISLVT